MVKKEKLSLEELLDQALVKDEDKPYAVPRNWVWTRLGIVCSINPPKITSKSFSDDLDVSFIPMAAVSEISGSVIAVETRKLHEVKNGYTNFADNDILFAKITPCMENGKSAIAIDLTNGIGYGSTEFHVLRVTSCVLNKFIFYLVRAKWFREDAKLHMSGSVGQQRVPKHYLENYNLPLPPLPEQQRIVDLIESLFGKLDRAKELAQNALDSFENRKSAILHKAFTGELTRKWREENNQHYNDLLKIILDYYANNSTNKDINNVQEFQRTVSVIETIEYSVWYKCSIGAIGTVCNGSTPSRKELKYWGGDIPWVSSGEVRNNVIGSTNERITADGYNNSSVKLLKEGTVLIAMIGEGKTRGQTSILNIDATINQNIAAIDLSHGVVISKFMWYWLQYQYKRNREEGNGSGPKALNCQRVRELDFVLPPLAEQKEIVRILDNLLENEQKAKELCDVIGKIDHMKKAILARAFRGELSTNNPDEESALELLKEVLKEKV